jgi:hypothetical protein
MEPAGILLRVELLEQLCEEVLKQDNLARKVLDPVHALLVSLAYGKLLIPGEAYKRNNKSKYS